MNEKKIILCIYFWTLHEISLTWTVFLSISLANNLGVDTTNMYLRQCLLERFYCCTSQRVVGIENMRGVVIESFPAKFNQILKNPFLAIK